METQNTAGVGIQYTEVDRTGQTEYTSPGKQGICLDPIYENSFNKTTEEHTQVGVKFAVHGSIHQCGNIPVAGIYSIQPLPLVLCISWAFVVAVFSGCLSRSA